MNEVRGAKHKFLCHLKNTSKRRGIKFRVCVCVFWSQLKSLLMQFNKLLSRLSKKHKTKQIMENISKHDNN